MAARIDNYLNNINPRVSTAEETARKLNVDKNLIDKAADKLGVDVLNDPACRQYFKTMGQSLQILTTRHWEIDYKADAGRVSSPRDFAQDAFLTRDTSQYQLYQNRLPDLSESLIDRWQEIGFLKQPQAEALNNLLFSEVPAAGNIESSTGEDPEYLEFLENFGKSEDAVVGAQQAYTLEENREDATAAAPRRNGTIGLGLTRNVGSRVPGLPSRGNPSTTGVDSTLSVSDYFGGGDAMAQDREVLDNYFPEGSSSRAWFEQLFESESRARETISNDVMQMQEITRRKREIMAELSGVDPSTPEGARKMAVLQYQMGDVGDSIRQITERIQSTMRMRTERIELIQKILDIQNQTLKYTSSKIN